MTSIVSTLRIIADDPMWADHCEVSKKTLRAAADEIDALTNILNDICAEWNEPCEDDCNSYGHSDKCRAVNIAAAKRALRERAERAEAERDAALERARYWKEKHDAEESANGGIKAERDWALSKAGITHGVYDELYALRAKCDALQEENERLRNNGKIVIESLCDACLVKLSGV